MCANRIFSTKLAKRGSKNQVKLSSLPKGLCERLGWQLGDNICFYCPEEGCLKAFKAGENTQHPSDASREIKKTGEKGSLYVSTLPSHLVDIAKWRRNGPVHMAVIDQGLPVLVMVQNKSHLESDVLLKKEIFIEEHLLELAKPELDFQKKLKWYRSNPEAHLQMLKKHHSMVVKEGDELRIYRLPDELEPRRLLFNAKKQELQNQIASKKNKSQRIPGHKKQGIGKKDHMGFTPIRSNAEGGI